MIIKRWGRRTGSVARRITNKELDYVFMELETVNLSAEVYRYHVEGLIVVYYIFEAQLLKNEILEPVYLSEEDIYFLGEPEDKLYQRILENTVGVLQTKLVPLHVYLNEIKTEDEEIDRKSVV